MVRVCTWYRKRDMVALVLFLLFYSEYVTKWQCTKWQCTKMFWLFKITLSKEMSNIYFHGNACKSPCSATSVQQLIPVWVFTHTQSHTVLLIGTKAVAWGQALRIAMAVSSTEWCVCLCVCVCAVGRQWIRLEEYFYSWGVWGRGGALS